MSETMALAMAAPSPADEAVIRATFMLLALFIVALMRRVWGERAVS